MAYRRSQLPSLKVTRRPTAGRKVCEVIQRGSFDQDGHHTSSDSQSPPPPPPSSPPPTGSMDATGYDGLPTGHELENQSMVAGWDGIRSGILAAVTEAYAMPPDQMCCACMAVAATLRCQRCGPSGYYCCDCFELFHQTVNIFHVADKWEV